MNIRPFLPGAATTVALVALLTIGLAGCDDGFEPVSKKQQSEPASPVVEKTAEPQDTTAAKPVTEPAPETVAVTATVEPKEEKWTAPKDRWEMGLKYRFTDQDGKAMTLADLKGRPLVASFIFTSCGNPEMCPLIVAKFAQLQRDAEKAGIGDKVWFVLISFDPKNDTPAMLKDYGQVRGFRWDNGRMLVPNAEDFRDFIAEYQVRIGVTPTGQLNHAIDLVTLDHLGGLVRNEGGAWDNARVLADLQRLVEEQHAETTTTG